MKRNTVDVTPDAAGRLVDMRDLDGDGTYEAISLFGHWAGYFGTTGAAGPYLPVVSAREGERFVPACRRFSQQLAPLLDKWRSLAEEDTFALGSGPIKGIPFSGEA